MCFNISIINSKNSIEKQLGAVFDTDFIFEPQNHISAFSNPLIPVITSENRENIQLYHWGLIPAWVKDRKQANEIRKLTYNAKSETITEKPSFRSCRRPGIWKGFAECSRNNDNANYCCVYDRLN